MSDEITINLALDVVKDNLRLSFRPSSITPDMAGEFASVVVQAIGTAAWENLTVGGDVVAGGYYWFQNLSTSTSTTFDPSIKVASCSSAAAGTSFPFLNLRAGEYAIGRAVTTSFSAISATATANLQFGLLPL